MGLTTKWSLILSILVLRTMVSSDVNSHSIVKYSSMIPLLNFIEFYEVGGNGTAVNGSAVTIDPNITTITPVHCNDTMLDFFALVCCPFYHNCTEAKTFCTNHLEIADFEFDEDGDPYIIECEDGSGCYTADEKCDVDPDCLDRSDENGCDYVCNTTDNFEFKCEKTGMCILEDFTCDGNRDCCNGADPVAWPGADNNTCADTTDEEDCPGCDTEEIVWRFSKANNGSGKVWQCKESGECIDNDNVCDGQDHCVDGSDEEDCLWYGRQKLSEAPEEQCRCYQCDENDFCFDNTGTEDCPRAATCGAGYVTMVGTRILPLLFVVCWMTFK